MIYHSCEPGFMAGMACCPGERRRPAPCCCHPCCPPANRPYPPVRPPLCPPTANSLSVLTAANSADTTVAAAAALPFAFNSLAYGSDIIHNPGSSAVSINTPGIYLVHFQAIATPLADATAGTITATLNQNGTAVPAASSSVYYGTATESNTLSFSTILSVNAVPSTLSITLPDSGAIFTESALSVYRLASIPTPAACCPTYPGTTVPLNTGYGSL